MSDTHHGTAALVIGGTQGLGLAIAKRLQAEGCRALVLAGRDIAKGVAVAEEIGASFLPVDLADPTAVISLVNESHQRMGRVTALVNAGAATDRASILDCTPELFDHIFAVNVRGPYFALQRVAQLAKAGGYLASVVNILTVSTWCGQSFLSPYSASKMALLNVTKNAAQALRWDRIRVNGINCGWMDTPGEDATQKRWHGAREDWLAKAEEAMPFGMLVKPSHVAGLASYMLGPESGVMTGSIVNFDQNVEGGMPETAADL